MTLNADFNEAPGCMAGAIKTLLCLVRVSPYLCLSVLLSLSLSIVCVVFPSLHVLCWSFLMGGRF